MNKHIEDHVVLVRCESKETMEKIIDAIRFSLPYVDDYEVNVVSDYDINYYEEGEE